MVTVPALAFNEPSSRPSNVDLPAPFSPDHSHPQLADGDVRGSKSHVPIIIRMPGLIQSERQRRRAWQFFRSKQNPMPLLYVEYRRGAGKHRPIAAKRRRY